MAALFVSPMLFSARHVHFPTCCAQTSALPHPISVPLPQLPVPHLPTLLLNEHGETTPPPSGTTSLLLSLSALSLKQVRAYIRTWVPSYIFSSSSLLQHPVSTSSDHQNSYIHFYARSTERGVLTFSVEPGPTGTLIRVTSSSRFTNRAGSYTATLPGERRIVRDLFSKLQSDFNDVSVLYKPPNLRLRRPRAKILAEITAFVGEVRHVKSDIVVAFLQGWVVTKTFAAFSGPFAARLPPLSAEPLEYGVRIRVGEKANGVINASVRKRGKGSGKVVVVVSTTNPDDAGTIAVLQRLSDDLLRRFPESRIHTLEKKRW